MLSGLDRFRNQGGRQSHPMAPPPVAPMAPPMPAPMPAPPAAPAGPGMIRGGSDPGYGISPYAPPAQQRYFANGTGGPEQGMGPTGPQMQPQGSPMRPGSGQPVATGPTASLPPPGGQMESPAAPVEAQAVLNPGGSPAPVAMEMGMRVGGVRPRKSYAPGFTRRLRGGSFSDAAFGDVSTNKPYDRWNLSPW